MKLLKVDRAKRVEIQKLGMQRLKKTLLEEYKRLEKGAQIQIGLTTKNLTTKSRIVSGNRSSRLISLKKKTSIRAKLLS